MASDDGEASRSAKRRKLEPPDVKKTAKTPFQTLGNAVRGVFGRRKTTTSTSIGGKQPNGNEAESAGLHQNVRIAPLPQELPALDATTIAEDQTVPASTSSASPQVRRGRGRPPKANKARQGKAEKKATTATEVAPLKSVNGSGSQVNGQSFPLEGSTLSDGIRSNGSLIHDISVAPSPEEKNNADAPLSGSARGRSPEAFRDIPKAPENGLVGILTPTKRKRGRPKKSVTFNKDNAQVTAKPLMFEDIPKDVVHNVRNRGPLVLSTGLSPAPVRSDPVQFEGSNATATSPVPDGVDIRRSNGTINHSPASSIPSAGTENFKDFLLRATDEGNRDRMVTVIKSILLDKLCGRSRIPLYGVNDEYRKVHRLVERSVVAGEGNSMLIIGARGSGKTTMVEQVISDLSVDHRDAFHVVRLNGFFHTDDKLALREIWRQLGREMEVDDGNAEKLSNYSDTLASLLALLSHPSELSDSEPERAAKSVVFVLDEFDLFASHPRQTLLYNLFDIAQSRKAPIAVIGLTTKIDVSDSLEKRVKSRFGHRHVHLSLAKSLPAFSEICKRALSITQEDVNRVSTPGEESTIAPMLVEHWTQFIDHLWQTDTILENLLHSIYYRTKSAREFFASCIIAISALSPTTTTHLTGRSLIQDRLAGPESKLHFLAGLSDLDIALLIAAARLDVILDTDTCNFNMAYDEYVSLASRARAQSSSLSSSAATTMASPGAAGSVIVTGARVWGRHVALAAWETLATYELIVPSVGAGGATGASGAAAAGGVSGSGGGAGSRDVARAGRMFRVDVALEEIAPALPGLAAVMVKWCKEI
ncbi:MAG: hypothetical protein M1825_001398 [Sarcosagium campestre]|nr:MAG: hypothetical protein M1825_001398 [Sarcosagium campestre]